jgi:hypothetical protein
MSACGTKRTNTGVLPTDLGLAFTLCAPTAGRLPEPDAWSFSLISRYELDARQLELVDISSNSHFTGCTLGVCLFNGVALQMQ